MRQVVLEAPETVVIREVDDLVPGRGEVRVHTEQVGIAASDLLLYRGQHPFVRLPVVPGHEVVGIVDGLGYGVIDFSLGDRVILEPVIACGECAYCRSGRTNLCDELSVIGSAIDRPGAMADHFLAPESHLIRADSRLTRPEAVMIEPLAGVIHAARIAGGTGGKRIAVLGAGTVGLLTLQAARASGASVVVVADPHEERRAQAASFGAGTVCDSRDPAAVETMREQLSGHADVIFDCVASQGSMNDAIALALKGGTIVVLGVPRYDVTIPLPLVEDRELRIQGATRYLHPDMLAAMELIADKRIEAGLLVSDVFPIEQAAVAFAAAASGTAISIHLTTIL
jgi:2-desacetyl-2-hydroxyethyl bacteriochlorophyllide A dehydrogenase